MLRSRLLLLVTLILSVSLSVNVPVKDLVSKSIRIFNPQVGKVSTWKNSGDMCGYYEGECVVDEWTATMTAARFDGVPGEIPSRLDMITKSYFGSSCVSTNEGMEITMKENILNQNSMTLNVLITDIVVTLSSLMVSQLVCQTPIEAGVTYSVKDISCTLSGIDPFEGLADFIGTEQMLPVEFSEEKVTIDGEEPMDLSRISSMGCTGEPTEAPTTVAPTTEAPTTAAPTTVAPTTVAPTTAAPTHHPTHHPTHPPTHQPPTHQPPTHQPPTHQPPTHQPPTPTPTPAPQNNIGIWILVGVVALVVVVILCYCCCRRSGKKEEAKAPLV